MDTRNKTTVMIDHLGSPEDLIKAFARIKNRSDRDGSALWFMRDFLDIQLIEYTKVQEDDASDDQSWIQDSLNALEHRLHD